MKQRLYSAVDETGKELHFHAETQGNVTSLTLPVEQFQNAKELHLLTSLSYAKAGDAGYYVLPAHVKLDGCIQTFFTEREDCCFDVERPLLTFYGIKKKDECLLIRVDRNYKLRFRAGVANGNYFAEVVIVFSEDYPCDDVRIEVVELAPDADYNDMAKAEREMRLSKGEIVTLAEKCKREAVEYARKYPLVRIRMGWKPSPCEVDHQTPENEPEMFVACTFARVRDIVDALKRKGVEGAEIQLVGWNIGGHDGRFPQLLPPDPRLGGEEEMKKTIAYVKEQGYRISLHTCSIDQYEIANSFDWSDAVITSTGDYKITGHLCGGIAYRACLKRQWKNIRRDLPPLTKFGLNGLHYTDVISIVVPDVCHDKNHPCPVGEGIVYAQWMMEYTRDLFGGFSSEGCMDFAMKYLDFGLYATFGDSFGKEEVPICDRYLPMFELIYHGIALYNPCSATINYVVKDPATRLKMVLQGGRPSFYIHSGFRTGGATNWMGSGSTDLICTTDADVERTADAIAEGEREHRALHEKQFLFMTRYDFITETLHAVTYSDGSRMVGNYSDAPAEFEGKTVAPFGYITL